MPWKMTKWGHSFAPIPCLLDSNLLLQSKRRPNQNQTVLCHLSKIHSTFYNHLQSANSTYSTLRWNSGLTQIVSMHWVAMHWVFSLQKCLFVKFNHWPICKHNTQHFLILQVKCVYPRCAKMNVQNHLWFSHLFNWHIFVISHKIDKGQRKFCIQWRFCK